MAWTYSESCVTATDKVRLLSGDTNRNDKLISDEEIAFALVSDSNVYKAAAIVCRAIAAKLRRRPSLTPTPGSISLDSQAQAKGFLELAIELDKQAVLSGGADFSAGGISREGKNENVDDPDRVPPGFTVNTHRSIGSGEAVGRGGWWPLDERD